MTPEEIVDLQVHYYNEKNLDAFCELFSESIVLYDFDADKEILEGMTSLKKRFKQRFQSPNLRAEVKSKMFIKNTVIHNEVVHGIENYPLETIAIYTVEDKKISRIHFVGL